MSSLFPDIDKSWQAVVFFLCMLVLPTHAVFAGDSYHVCSKTPRNDMAYLQQADDSIHYTFSGDLKCHIHYNYDAFHSLPSNGNDASGDYRVEASFRNNKFHEQIWINMPHHYGGSPAIVTSYTCQADPLRYKNPHCQKQQRTTPNPTEWQGAVEEAASFTVPLSFGLASKSILASLIEPPAGQVGNPPPQQEDLAGPMVKSLVTDISFIKNQFSDFKREYFFSFSTPASGHYEKLEAKASKYVNSQVIDVYLSGSGHQITLTYKCNNIMDPFLDPDNKCTLTGSSSAVDSLYQGLIKQKYPLVYLFSNAISNAKREQLRWKALADSMRPGIIVNGKTVAQDTGTQTLPGGSPPNSAEIDSNAEIMLKVESARDIRRSGDQQVLFIVENKKYPTNSITDIEGNKIPFPLSSKYTGNSYNSTVQSIKNLEPGNYVYFTQIATSLTSLVSSKKIPFQVTSHIGPKQKPVIVEPQENQQFKKGSAFSLQVLVAKPMFGTGFDANVEIEHSRLAKQEAYKSLSKELLKNQGTESIVGVQRVINDADQNPITGDFRIRAKMVYDGKEVGQWSKWRHFHIGGKSIGLMHRGLSILSPKQDQTYTNTIPVKISLPETMKKEGDLTLTWAMVGDSVARELIRKTITVKPETTFETEQDVAELVAETEGKIGTIQLSVSLKGSKQHDSAQLNVAMLGEPAQMGSNKMSGSLTLDTPIVTAPAEHQIFMAPATIKVEIVHKPEIKISTELEYCPFSTEKTAIITYQPIPSEGAVSHSEKGKTTLTYNLTKPGWYQIRACNNDKIAQWSTWRHFKVDTISSGLTSTSIAPQVVKFDQPAAPKILAPKNHATFTSDEPITLRVQNGPPKKYWAFQIEEKTSGPNSQYQYRGQFYKMKATDQEIVEDIANNIWGDDKKSRPGEYRFRIGFTYKPTNTLYSQLNWSKWRYFRVFSALHNAPHLIDQKNILPGAGIKKTKPSTKMINPQPEPPGKQVRPLSMSLQVVPFPHSFKAPATVNIKVKNTPFSRMPFELGYRPGNEGAYKSVQHPQHTFAHTNKATTLTLSLQKPGQYRVRFRKNHKSPWTRWTSFQVTENLTKAAALAQKLRILPGNGIRAINPQPEPPGKQIRAQHAMRNNGIIRTQADSQLKLSRQRQLPPPEIKTPKDGQKFLMTGKSMHVKAEISHTAGQKIQVEVQHEKQHRYLPMKKEIRTHRMKHKTTVDMLISSTGTYRLRIKDRTNGSHWSKWTTFYVDKVTKNMPRFNTKKPTTHVKKHPAHPAAVPAIQLAPRLK